MFAQRLKGLIIIQVRYLLINNLVNYYVHK